MATDDEGRTLLREAQVLAAQRAVAEIDLLRRLPALAQQLSPARLALSIGLTQAAVEALLERAETLPPAAPGFSGADPYEIIQRYVIGELDRWQLVDELSRWTYAPKVWGDWEGYTPGDWETFMIPAAIAGLIDDEIYTQVSRALPPGVLEDA